MVTPGQVEDLASEVGARTRFPTPEDKLIGKSNRRRHLPAHCWSLRFGIDVDQQGICLPIRSIDKRLQHKAAAVRDREMVNSPAAFGTGGSNLLQEPAVADYKLWVDRFRLS